MDALSADDRQETSSSNRAQTCAAATVNADGLQTTPVVGLVRAGQSNAVTSPVGQRSERSGRTSEQITDHPGADLTTRTGSPSARPVNIKAEPPDEITDYAENTMNELLGLYGYGKLNRIESQQLKHQSDDTDDMEEMDGEDSETEERSESVEPDVSQSLCHWCQKSANKFYSLKTPSGHKVFCSEVCFQQCRRASFKSNKSCDWCKHTRYTVNYVDFQDGDHQVQFCSDKCLNQYKMNIFCRETQEHLKKIRDEPSTTRSRHSSAEILITPDLWMKPDSATTTSAPSPEVKREIVNSLRSGTPEEKVERAALEWEMKIRQGRTNQRKTAHPKQISLSPQSTSSLSHGTTDSLSPVRSADSTPGHDKLDDQTRHRRALDMEKASQRPVGRLPESVLQASQMLPMPQHYSALPPGVIPSLHYPPHLLHLPPPPHFLPPGFPMLPSTMAPGSILPFPVLIPVPFPLPVPVPILPKGVTAEDVREFVAIMKKKTETKATKIEKVTVKTEINGDHLVPRDQQQRAHDRKCMTKRENCINCASCQVSRRGERASCNVAKRPGREHKTVINNNNNNCVSSDHSADKPRPELGLDYEVEGVAIDLSKSKKVRAEERILTESTRDTNSAPLPKINIVPSRPPLAIPPMSTTPLPAMADINPHSSRRGLILDSPNAPIGKKRSPSPETQRTRNLIDYKKRCLRARIKTK